MSDAARKTEFIQEVTVYQQYLAGGGAMPMPKPLMDGIRSMLSSVPENAVICDKLELCSRDRDAGPPSGQPPADPIVDADCVVILTSLNAWPDPPAPV
jgi:hypothetical protein